MNLRKTIIFWGIVWVCLTLFFSVSIKSLIVSFFFVTFLLPIVLSTSLVFNRYLVPKYLLKGIKLKFALYMVYLIIVSIYLELLVMILAFVILADYQIDNLGKIASDIYLMTIVLYLIVLIEGLVLSIQNLKDREQQLVEVSNALQKEREEEIVVRVNRKNMVLKLSEILYIESLGDYVKIHISGKTLTTKEKISSFEDRLPKVFLRIHRSFIVNKDSVDSFNKERVIIGDQELSIGRKYKSEVEESLVRDVTV